MVPGRSNGLCSHGDPFDRTLTGLDPPVTGSCRRAGGRFGSSAPRFPGWPHACDHGFVAACAAPLADLLRLHDASLATVAAAEGSRLQLTLPGRGKAA